jgi:isopentenyl diphosphate isomerase/L-lactate dehydrogenase-like FMN-dependent dehydrogenase
VESYRQSPQERDIAREFDSWGLPTALIQAVIGRCEGRIIASGGIRTGFDIAKSIALGAQIAGLALPFIRAVYAEGPDGAVELGLRLGKVLKMAMFLTGCQNLEPLRSVSYIMEDAFKSKVEQFKKIEGIYA